MPTRATWILASLLISGSVRSAAAQPETSDEAITHDASADVETGAILPWMTAARHDHQEIQAQMFGGRDSTTNTSTFASAIEATLIDRVAVRTTFANDGYDSKLRPTVGLSVDALRQDRAGVDLALSGTYASRGYNTVPALIVRAAVSRTLGPATLLGNVEYGVGLEDNERYGALGLAAIDRLATHWYAGIASQAHLDLERDNDEPAEERDWDVNAGPIVSYATGPFVLSASTGVAAWQFRLQPEKHVGGLGMLGVAAVF
jgi:hypothetical protein